MYRAGDPKESIPFFWGDGQEEILPLSSSQVHPSGFRVDTYHGSLQYDTTGYVEVGFTDGYLVDEVVNIENSWQKEIEMRDSVYIFPEGHPFSANWCPEFSSSQFQIYLDNGIITHPANSTPINEPWNVDRHVHTLVPFPSEDYSFPEATNGIYFDHNNGGLFWDRPVAPGSYAICIKVREWREDFYDEFPGDSILMSTTHRAMMIDVDSSMLVSTIEPWLHGIISIFPNPAGALINVQLGGFSSTANIRIFDVNGREMFSEKVLASPQLETLEVGVSAWPRGVYFVHIETVDGHVTRKVVLE